MINHQAKVTVGEKGYLHLLKHILENGYKTDERTGTGTIVSPTPHQLHFPNVAKEFPLITTKYVSFNMLAVEMLWFISGSANTNYLKDMGSPAMKKVWDKWADRDGKLGPVYGNQWRFWKYECGDTFDPKTCFIDQLEEAIDSIKQIPTSRRIIVTAWNPGELKYMALPPCHMTYQFTCEPLTSEERWNRVTTGMIRHSSDLDELGVPKYKLHLHMLQRSCDMFLGVPFNVAQYALLLLMVSKVTNTIPGGFTWTGVNCHIYQNHIDAVNKQLSRFLHKPPVVTFGDRKIKSIDGFTIDDIYLNNYQHHPKIEAEVSV